MAADISDQPISFQSHGFRCAAHVYRSAATDATPPAPAAAPAIILCTGFSGTADWLMPDYAAAFARAGFVAVTFDYHRFGESEGEPRQLVDVKAQREDIVAVLQLTRTLAGVDPARVALWGTSLGGGHVLAVAADTPGIAAVIAQAPAIDLIRGGGSSKYGPLMMGKLLAATAFDILCERLDRAPHYVKVFGRPGETAFFSGEALQRRLAGIEEHCPSWRNQVAARFLLRPPRYREGSAERIPVPVLFCLAERDEYVSNSFALWVARRIARAQVRTYPCSHFELYDPPVRDTAIRDQIAFLNG